MSTNPTRRIARKAHRCDGCLGPIEPKHVYLVHILFPGNDIWDNEVPMRNKQCADCAIRYGRDWEIEPFPHNDQPYRYWLGDVPPRDPDPLSRT